MQAGAHARVAATATPCSRNGKNALINNIIHKNRKNVKKNLHGYVFFTTFAAKLQNVVTCGTISLPEHVHSCGNTTRCQ